MEWLEVEGGRPLAGSVRPSGAKNAALKLMAASLLADGPCVLGRVPRIRDVEAMRGLLEAVGARAAWSGPQELAVHRSGELLGELPEQLVGALRASVQLAGPLVALGCPVRLGRPGGCEIGDRPLDLHLQGLAALGVRVEERGSWWELYPPRRLSGAEVVLEYPSVGATENVMMAASRARGTTIIYNPAREPEVVELQGFLRAMGARVEGAGGPCIRIEGRDALEGARWEVMPDRIETATWLLAAAITGGHVEVAPAVPQHLGAVVQALQEAGVGVSWGDGWMRAEGASGGRVRAVSIQTQPYPGFPTDVQPLWTALMTVARGVAVVREEVYSRRFGYVSQLWAMGADIRVEGRHAVVRGARLHPARVQATDLRGGAALVLAALAAQGLSHIGGLSHLDRGYEELAAKLAGLGGRVRRVRSEPVPA
ncbi:MAG TPA: UDP-N-acetylglucosamine 1-carboxyvinyltransferase [Limnochordales bacterium]